MNDWNWRLLPRLAGAAVLLLGVTGCTERDDARANSQPTAVAAPAPQPMTAPAAERPADKDDTMADKFEGHDNLDDNWIFFATGALKSVEKLDVDKSGRGQKFNYILKLEPETVDRPEGEATLPDVLMFNVKDVELRKLTTAELKAGSRVEVKVMAYGRRPESFRLRALKAL